MIKHVELDSLSLSALPDEKVFKLLFVVKPCHVSSTPNININIEGSVNTFVSIVLRIVYLIFKSAITAAWLFTW